ncbi:MAG: hypothetical protein ACP5RH_01075 [Leptodesmis sp.]|uniref:hypothetical protein n=1 Tax=Leptodesmis sp. TaxID=3100501 RepID=UPI003D0BB606
MMKPTPGSLLAYLDAKCGPSSHECGKICLPVHKKCRKSGALGEAERGKKAAAYAKHLKAGGKDTRKGIKPSAEELAAIGQKLSPDNRVRPFKRVSPTAKGLATEAQRTIQNLTEMGKAARLAGEAQKAKEETREKIAQKVLREAQNMRLRDRESRGIVGNAHAKAIAILKRTFELLNPNKLIKVPRGTTQQEYWDILQKLNNGDKEAIKQYTVPKPKGYKTARDRQKSSQKNASQAKRKKRKDSLPTPTPGSILEYLTSPLSFKEGRSQPR